MTDTFVDAKVQRIQAMLYAKASHEPQTRFNRLYKYLTRREWVRAATNHVLSNRGSRTAGIDGMTRASYQDVAKHEALVQTIQEELATQAYCPVAVRRTFIPKANGKKRPLGIPIWHSYCIPHTGC